MFPFYSHNFGNLSKHRGILPLLLNTVNCKAGAWHWPPGWARHDRHAAGSVILSHWIRSTALHLSQWRGTVADKFCRLAQKRVCLTFNTGNNCGGVHWLSFRDWSISCCVNILLAEVESLFFFFFKAPSFVVCVSYVASLCIFAPPNSQTG